MDEKVSNSFAAEGIQYSKDTSYYALAASTGSGLGDSAGVTSLNGAIGNVVIAGANGVAVSTGPAPTVSLGDITPLSVNTPGAIGGAAISAYSATFTGAVNASGGTLSANSINATGNITTGLAVNCGTVTATGALNAASMNIAGTLTTGSFAIPGSLQVGSITPGSLGATAVKPLVWGDPTSVATLVIAGWRLSWGMASPADTNGNIGVTFNPPFASVPAISFLPVRAGGGDAFMANGLGTPTSTGFTVSCINRSSGNAFGATISWIAFGQA
jgi:hypothetical protein